MNKSNKFSGHDPDPDVRSIENDSKRIAENAESYDSKIFASKKLARFFEVEITLKIFGQVIWHVVFPPQK